MTRFSEYYTRVKLTLLSVEKKDKELHDKPAKAYIFEIENKEWEHEDYMNVDEKHKDWLNFKKYIDSFFEEEKPSGHNV